MFERLAKPLGVDDNHSARMHRWPLAAAFLMFGVSSARANPDSAIPPECGSRAAFDQALVERLGAEAPLDRVSVTITSAEPHSHLRVQVGDEVRTLDDPSCTELFRASFVIAMAMLGHEDAPPPNEPAPSEPAPPLPAPTDTTTPRYPELSLAAGVGLSIGTLPDPVPAFELESKLLWRYVGASASLRYLFPADELTSSNKGVELRAWGVAASGIFRPSRLWEVRLGFAAQRLSGEGSGAIAQQGTDSAWAAGPTLGLAFVPLQIPPLWAGVGAEGQLNALRGRFEILNYYQPVSSEPYVVYRVPWLAASAFVRLGVVW